MIKKSISVMTVVFMAFGFMLTANAQEDKSYAMWESIMLTPDNTKLKVLGDNMRAHNAKYHKEGPYDATVYNITTGPNSGKLIWMMGPMNYKHNDTRPGEGGHDEDWRDKVMPYIKKMHTIEYWKQDDKLSNTSMLTGDPSAYPLQFIRYSEFKDGVSNSSINQFYKLVGETIKAMEGVNPWGIYYNEFRQGDLGRHVATVGFYKNWAEFDEDNNFKKTFESKHGAENWQAFLDLGDQIFDNSWDEVWSYNKHMSGK